MSWIRMIDSQLRSWIVAMGAAAFVILAMSSVVGATTLYDLNGDQVSTLKTPGSDPFWVELTLNDGGASGSATLHIGPTFDEVVSFDFSLIVNAQTLPPNGADLRQYGSQAGTEIIQLFDWTGGAGAGFNDNILLEPSEWDLVTFTLEANTDEARVFTVSGYGVPPVPEPAAGILAAVGMVGGLVLRRKFAGR